MVPVVRCARRPDNGYYSPRGSPVSAYLMHSPARDVAARMAFPAPAERLAMTSAPQHPHEPDSNAERDAAARLEPRALRTYTPTQAVLAASAGVFHWTPEGRRLYDFTSGVLVANLGHNPRAWQQRFAAYMGWDTLPGETHDYFRAVPLTAYNAVTPVE